MKRRLHILVVDDFAAMREIVRTQLGQLGHDAVTEAADGGRALALLRERRFDLLITGWNMPVLDGLGLVREIRSDPELRALPVLMVSAEARRERVLAAADEGVSDYLVKPFDAGLLARKIDPLVADTV